jgi:hypothetical protein
MVQVINEAAESILGSLDASAIVLVAYAAAVCGPCPKADLEEFWRHAVAVEFVARATAFPGLRAAGRGADADRLEELGKGGEVPMLLLGSGGREFGLASVYTLSPGGDA